MKLPVFAMLTCAAVLVFCLNGHCAGEVYSDARTGKTAGLVMGAAKMIEKDGENAFFEFNKDGSPWRRDTSFLVFDVTGTLFVYRDFSRLGENIKELLDGSGNAYLAEAVRTLSSGKTSTWVPYPAENGEKPPKWRVYYLTSAISPSGRPYIVGADIPDVPPEKEIIKDIVEVYFKRSAAEKDLYSETAKKARASLSFPGTSVFAFSPDQMKAADPKSEERAIMDTRDSGGSYTARSIIAILPENSSAWIDYVWVKPGGNAPSRRTAYIKKIYVNGKTAVIGAGQDR
jgi:hypothetical protein